MLAFKEQVVGTEGWRPSCRRVTVPVDLSADWGRGLVEHGLDTEAPVAWLAEGRWAATLHETAERSAAYGRAPDDIGGEVTGAGLVEAVRG